MAMLSAKDWEVLSPRLEEALSMTESERSNWLSSLRTQDPDLVSRLETLLLERSLISHEHFLENRSAELPVRQGLEGQTLGAYRLISEIGQGGMGSVWLAERSDGRFERRVAVKFLNLALIGKTGEERFKREGRILAHLVHPHIAELIDAGVSPAGQPYLVLEHIEGDHIDRYCDRNRLDVAARIRLFLEILQAVAQAHASLIVHRDLKPSNVLVRNDGLAKLLDFGIAKLLEDDHTSETQLTVQGVRAMTPECAAPEQLRGGPITTATDIYSLGVLLYVLLTGQHPAGPGPHAPADLVKAIVDTEPVLPSKVAALGAGDAKRVIENAARRGTTPGRLSRLLRGDLDTIIAKTLKKEPSERYSSVAALADDLNRHLGNVPISARPDTLAYRAAKFLRRNRAAVALTTLAALATSAGIVGTLVQARTARAQRNFAFRQLSRAERMNDLNALLLTDVAPMGKPLKVNELLDREERIVEREHDDDPASHAEMLMSIGDQYSGQEEHAKAMRVLNEAYQLSRSLPDRSTRAKASCMLSFEMVPIGDLARAESLVQEGLREMPNQPQFGPERVHCLVRGSEIAYRNGDSRLAVARAQEAERLLKELPVHSPLQDLDVLGNVAGVYGGAGRFIEANAAFERASVLMTSLGYDETRKAVELFNDWALTLTFAGRPLEAEKAYRRAIEISRINQADDAVLPTLMYNYGAALRELGRLPEAADYAERAFAKAQSAGDQILINQTTLLRARVYRDRREFRRAASMFAEVEPRLRQTLPPGHYAFASLVSDKSLMAQMQGDFTTALQLADQAVAMDEATVKAGGQGAAYIPSLLVRRSAAELELGQKDRALADAAKALTLQQSATQPGTFSCTTGRAYLALGRALESQGQLEEARSAYRSAAEQLQSTLGPDHSDTRAARKLADARAPRV